MREVSRRDFLKFSSGVLATVATGEILHPLGVKINDSVENITKHPAGNAGIRDRVEEACKDSSNKNECFEKGTGITQVDKIMASTVSPVFEETIFRALPCFGYDIASNINNMTDDITPFVNNLAFGTGGIGMTRGEFITGVISSVLFGAVHNITQKGIDTKTIPASQTVAGMIFWYLQRKFGYFSNTIAHALVNLNVSLSLKK